jgi:hypothetical protein
VRNCSLPCSTVSWTGLVPVNTMTRTVAAELGERGITGNAITPAGR